MSFLYRKIRSCRSRASNVNGSPTLISSMIPEAKPLTSNPIVTLSYPDSGTWDEYWNFPPPRITRPIRFVSGGLIKPVIQEKALVLFCPFQRAFQNLSLLTRKQPRDDEKIRDRVFFSDGNKIYVKNRSFFFVLDVFFPVKKRFYIDSDSFYYYVIFHSEKEKELKLKYGENVEVTPLGVNFRSVSEDCDDVYKEELLINKLLGMLPLEEDTSVKKKKRKERPPTKAKVMEILEEIPQAKRFTIFPEDLQKAFDLVKRFSDHKEEDFTVPRYFRKCMSNLPLKAAGSVLLKVFTNYNFYFNTYHINGSCGLITRRNFFIFDNNINIKKRHTTPFEDFLNQMGEEVKKYKKKNFKTKKRKKIEKEKIFKKYVEELGILSPYHLSCDELTSVLFSHYMAKKNIFLAQDDPDLLIAKHKELMERSPIIDQNFLGFLRETVRRLFSSFEFKLNKDLVLPNKSYNSFDKTLLAHDEMIGSLSREEYNNYLETGETTPYIDKLSREFFNAPHSHLLKIVRDKGKSRAITTNHPMTVFMKPVQDAVSKFLQTNRVFFYTRNQVKKNARLISSSPDDYILSGDYENSTDYIPSQFTQVIWHEICKKIPKHLAKIVKHSLKSEKIYYPTKSGGWEGLSIRCGQLMGSLTSFPALCILNYTFNKYIGINKLLINGDDVLALCSEKKKDLWVNSEVAGMKVNVSKSHFNPVYGTFNSQLLCRHIEKKYLDRPLYHIPHVQISKLRNGSLLDYLQKPTNIHERFFFPMMRRYSKFHPVQDLLYGGFYTRKELSKMSRLSVYKPFCRAYTFLKRCDLLYLGSCEEFSLEGHSDDVQEMINYNWTHTKEGREKLIPVGNGVSISVIEYFKYGGQYKNELRKIKNLFGGPKSQESYLCHQSLRSSALGLLLR